MALLDITFDLKPAYRGGLDVLVDRFQVIQLQRTQEHFLSEPYLRDHLRGRHGWINVYPNWIVAPLLSFSLPPNMDEKDALQLIRGPIESELKRLASRELPVLEFHGRLHIEQTETAEGILIEKASINSKPAAWVAELRENIGLLARSLGFDVHVIHGSVSHGVRIHLRKPYKGTGIAPALPIDQSNFLLTFDKVGFRRRFIYGTAQSERFGSILSVNFGNSAYVTSGGSQHIGFLGEVLDADQFPSVSDANRPRVTGVSAKPPILELHESTIFPLESDVEIAVAASLRMADCAAAPRNAHVAWEVARGRLFSESLVLLKVSRDPKEYHEKLATCDELQKCRFRLPSGAMAFVHPEQHDVAMKAAELIGGLIPQQMLVSQDLEAKVMKVIRRIPCNSKVRVRYRAAVPVGLASEAASVDMKIKVERTFIHVDMPSSLRSFDSGQCVVSTTDARNSRNPRRA